MEVRSPKTEDRSEAWSLEPEELLLKWFSSDFRLPTSVSNPTSQLFSHLLF